MKSITTETNIKVEFYDLDPMNIVWHGNYVKYLENKLREAFGFKGTPIKISAKEKGEKK